MGNTQKAIGAASMAATLESWFTTLRSGRTLLLGVDPLAGHLTPGALAASTLQDLLEVRSAAGHVRLLTGSAELGDGAVHLMLQQGGVHEVAWMAAGQLAAQLAAGGAGEEPWSSVVYLDPWVVSLDAQIRTLWPAVTRSLVDDVAFRTAADAPFWGEWATWLKARTLDHTIPVTEILALSRGPWRCDPGEGPDSQDGFALGEERFVLLDESSASPPSPEGLRAAQERWRDRPIMLVTPHLTAYRRDHAALLDGLRVAVSSDDLSPRTYAQLLGQADVYVAPNGAPFGPAPLAALAPGTTVLLPKGHDIPEHVAAHQPQDRVQEPPSARRLIVAEPVESALRERARPEATQSAVARPDQALGQWWKSLSPLLQRAGADSPAMAQSGASASTRQASGHPPALADICILTCCYKYLQRFRIFLDSLVRQDYPLDRIEICVAAPGNPDGLRDYLQLVRQVHPALRLITIDLPEDAHTNKGKMLNAAFALATAPVVMVSDCDLVLPRSFMRTILAAHRPEEILGCWRTPMSPATTARILIGDLDPVEAFAELSQQWDEAETKDGVRQGLLGYCQVVARSAMAQVPYPEEFEGFNQSDIVFVDRLRERLDITGQFRKDLFVLHLSHRRDWTGTKVFL